MHQFWCADVTLLLCAEGVLLQQQQVSAVFPIPYNLKTVDC
jgi:hypothetical protein